MLSQIFSALSRLLSQEPSTKASLKLSDLSASSPAQSPEFSNSHDLMTKGLAQIKRHEGLVLHAYKDSLGYLTIGYGRLIDKAKGGGISEGEAEYLLQNDVSIVLSALQRNITFFERLSVARQAVLMNMAFQMGINGLLKFKKTLTLIEMGDYDAAADNMLKSLWAKQTPNRAAEMAEQMRTGQWQSG
jgi:lysozyme